MTFKAGDRIRSTLIDTVYTLVGDPDFKGTTHATCPTDEGTRNTTINVSAIEWELAPELPEKPVIKSPMRWLDPHGNIMRSEMVGDYAVLDLTDPAVPWRDPVTGELIEWADQ